MTENERKFLEATRLLGVEKTVYLLSRFTDLVNGGLEPMEAVNRIREQEMF